MVRVREGAGCVSAMSDDIPELGSPRKTTSPVVRETLEQEGGGGGGREILSHRNRRIRAFMRTRGVENWEKIFWGGGEFLVGYGSRVFFVFLAGKGSEFSLLNLARLAWWGAGGPVLWARAGRFSSFPRPIGSRGPKA